MQTQQSLLNTYLIIILLNNNKIIQLRYIHGRTILAFWWYLWIYNKTITFYNFIFLTEHLLPTTEVVAGNITQSEIGNR